MFIVCVIQPFKVNEKGWVVLNQCLEFMCGLKKGMRQSNTETVTTLEALATLTFLCFPSAQTPMQICHCCCTFGVYKRRWREVPMCQQRFHL